MGQHAEMQLSGLLDWDGSYTGSQEDDREYYNNQAHARNNKVRSFMALRGIAKGTPQKQALRDYGKAFGADRPTFHACENWTGFKEFINNRVGFNPKANKEAK